MFKAFRAVPGHNELIILVTGIFIIVIIVALEKCMDKGRKECRMCRESTGKVSSRR